MKKIGFLYVKGTVPAFEDFGKLPTHIVKNNGLVNGKKAHRELDGLIIPGGSIMESQSIGDDLKREILKMNAEGKFIFGMCSGFQLLANKTDVGRKSPCPIEKEGLRILDVSFSPMISTDRIEAEILDESFLTRGMVGQRVTGFHCHTYGAIEGDAKPLFMSLIKRMNYKDNPQKILSGVRNDEGNVAGTMIHGLLDYNLEVVQNILNFIDANEKDIIQIENANKKLLKHIKAEIGVNSGIMAGCRLQGSKDSLMTRGSAANLYDSKTPKILMLGSTGSESGKTFITTGLVGILRKKGYKVGVLKVGPDVRDIIPSLYLNKEKMEDYSSIKIGGLGWKNIEDVLKDIKSENYDIVLVEGVMSVFTGLLNEKVPFSAAEIAKAANIPVVLISGCSKGGIETAAVDLVGHVDIMRKMGLNVTATILNKVYDEKIAEAAYSFIKTRTGLDCFGVPKVGFQERGNIPEVEIKLEEFGMNSMKTVEKYIDVDKLIVMASKPEFGGYMDHTTIKDIFK